MVEALKSWLKLQGRTYKRSGKKTQWLPHTFSKFLLPRPHSSSPIYDLSFYFKKTQNNQKGIFTDSHLSLKLNCAHEDQRSSSCAVVPHHPPHLLKDTATADISPQPPHHQFPLSAASFLLTYKHDVTPPISKTKTLLSWLHIILHLMSHFPSKLTLQERAVYTISNPFIPSSHKPIPV